MVCSKKEPWNTDDRAYLEGKGSTVSPATSW